MGVSVASSLFGCPVVLGRWIVRVGNAVFRFEEYGIEERPARTGCVYSLARLRSNRLEHLYIGMAPDLPERLAGHEALAPAAALGANRLLVHMPGFASVLPAAEAARILVAALKPPLNGAAGRGPRRSRTGEDM